MSDQRDYTDAELDALYEKACRQTTLHAFEQLHAAFAHLGRTIIEAYTPRGWIVRFVLMTVAIGLAAWLLT